MIKLKSLLELANPPAEQNVAAQPPAKSAAAVQTAPPAQSAAKPAAPDQTELGPDEYSPAFDFNEFETKLAQSTESAKNAFQEKLMSRVGGKKVLIRASKGYGQPKKDYTINVTGVSIDFYYERYVVIFKDEKDKEYFLETGMKVKILGPAEIKTNKNAKTSTPAPKAVPAPVPAEKAPNTATQEL